MPYVPEQPADIGKTRRTEAHMLELAPTALLSTVRRGGAVVSRRGSGGLLGPLRYEPVSV